MLNCVMLKKPLKITFSLHSQNILPVLLYLMFYHRKTRVLFHSLFMYLYNFFSVEQFYEILREKKFHNRGNVIYRNFKKKHCFRFVVKPQDLKICKPVRPRQYDICIFFQ